MNTTKIIFKPGDLVKVIDCPSTFYWDYPLIDIGLVLSKQLTHLKYGQLYNVLMGTKIYQVWEDEIEIVRHVPLDT